MKNENQKSKLLLHLHGKEIDGKEKGLLVNTTVYPPPLRITPMSLV